MGGDELDGIDILVDDSEVTGEDENQERELKVTLLRKSKTHVRSAKAVSVLEYQNLLESMTPAGPTDKEIFKFKILRARFNEQGKVIPDDSIRLLYVNGNEYVEIDPDEFIAHKVDYIPESIEVKII